MKPELSESIQLAIQARVKAKAAVAEAEAARPRDDALVRAARGAVFHARHIERVAYDNAVAAELDTPAVRALLKTLETLNADLKRVADNLGAAQDGLEEFARVATGVIGVIKALTPA